MLKFIPLISESAEPDLPFDREVVRALKKIETIPFRVSGSGPQTLTEALNEYAKTAGDVLKNSFQIGELKISLVNPIRKSENGRSYLGFNSGHTKPIMKNGLVQGVDWIYVSCMLFMQENAWVELAKAKQLSNLWTDEENEDVRQWIYRQIEKNWFAMTIPNLTACIRHEMTHVGQFKIRTNQTYKLPYDTNVANGNYFYSPDEMQAHASQVAHLLLKNNYGASVLTNTEILRKVLKAHLDVGKWYLDTDRQEKAEFWKMVGQYMTNN